MSVRRFVASFAELILSTWNIGQKNRRHVMAANNLSWAARIKRRAKQARTGMAMIMNERMLVTGKEVVLATPVKTGRMRSNWVAGLTPSSSVRPAYKDLGGYSPRPYQQAEMAETSGPNYSGAVRQHKLVAQTHLNPLQPIFLTNSTPYIKEVNYGTAKQTAVGFIERGIDRSRAIGAVSRKARIFGRGDPFVRF
jgi:hypothetical protein